MSESVSSFKEQLFESVLYNLMPTKNHHRNERVQFYLLIIHGIPYVEKDSVLLKIYRRVAMPELNS